MKIATGGLEGMEYCRHCRYNKKIGGTPHSYYKLLYDFGLECPVKDVVEKLCENCDFREYMQYKCFSCRYNPKPWESFAMCKIKQQWVSSDDTACERFEPRFEGWKK